MGLFDAHAYLADTTFSHIMADRDSILQTFQRYAVSAAVLISGLAVDCDYVAGNRRLQEVVDAQFGLYGCVTLNPDDPQGSMEQQRLYLGRREFLAGAMFPRNGNPVNLE